MSLPNNASLANAVRSKDLKKKKKGLDHVPLDAAPSSLTGGKHVGPTKEQADFGGPARVHQHVASGSEVHSSGGNRTTAAVSGEVAVQSQVTTDTVHEVQPQAIKQISSLLNRLSTTTSQVDDYSRRQNEKISADAAARIQAIIGDTQKQQEALLADASGRSMEIEAEYNSKLKAFLSELDASKASNLAALEKDLDFRQTALLQSARDNIDQIHQDATRQKMAVMQQANASVIQDVDSLTGRVKQLGEAEMERRMNSKTTTVITTETHTEGHAKAAAAADVTIGDKIVAESSERVTTTSVASEPQTMHATTRI